MNINTQAFFRGFLLKMADNGRGIPGFTTSSGVTYPPVKPGEVPSRQHTKAYVRQMAELNQRRNPAGYGGGVPIHPSVRAPLSPTAEQVSSTLPRYMTTQEEAISAAGG